MSHTTSVKPQAASPKARPILFSAPMVRAILEGRKTQTRRIVKPQPRVDADGVHFGWASFYVGGNVHTWDENGVGGQNWNGDEYPSENRYEQALKRTPHPKPCPYGVPGDRLWVREAWRRPHCAPRTALKPGQKIQYCADGDWHDGFGESWRHSIHMPRWASRLTLEVTGIRVQRVQDISEDDAYAEGIKEYDNGTFGMDDPGACMGTTAAIAFHRLWDTVNGPGAWERNDWVWVVGFRRVSIGGAA